MELHFQPDEHRAGIYRFYNVTNDRFYIGSCKRFKTRWKQHLAQLAANKHPNPYLQHDYNKCGASSFHFEIIEFVDGIREDRLAREQAYLDKLYDKQQQCYNLCDRAISREGIKARNPEATRERHIAASKKLWEQPQYRTNQSSIQSQRTKELWQDPEYRSKHEEAIRNSHRTPEFSQKASASAKAKWSDPEFLARVESIYQTDEFKAQVGEHSKALWADEAHRQKQSVSRKTSWANDIERKRKASDRMKARLAKTYTLQSPSGEVITFTNMQTFSSERGLHSSGLCKVASGKWSSYKGWTKPI